MSAATKAWARWPGGQALRRAGLLLAAGLAAGLLAACERGGRGEGHDALAQPIAVVNDEEVPYRDFQALYQDYLSRWDRFLNTDGEQNRELRRLVLERMVERKLLDQEARRRGIEVGQESLLERVREVIRPFDQGYLEQAVQSAHRSVGEWTREFHRRQVHRRLIEQAVLERIRVTDREVRRYYEEHPEEFDLPERVRVRHLAVATRKQYRTVRRQLRRGTDFVELIRQHSITPDREQDGDLGYVKRGVLPPEFDEVIFDIESVDSFNNLNQPVKTQIGYHIFRLLARKEARKLPLHEAAPLIRDKLVQRKQSAAYALWIERLRKRAAIRIDHKLLDAELG